MSEFTEAETKADTARTVAVTRFNDRTDSMVLGCEALQPSPRLLLGSSLVPAGAARELGPPLARARSSIGLAASTLKRVLLSGSGTVEAAAPPMDCAAALAALEGAEEAVAAVEQIVGGLRLLGETGFNDAGVVDLHLTLRRVLEQLRPELCGVARIECQFDSVPPVKADVAGLEVALANVLHNAAQAIPEGCAGYNSVYVRTRRGEGQEVVVEIEDTGAGIEPADLPRVFEPFFTSKPTPSSSGLGLPIAHALLAAMNGRVLLFSTAGLGTLVRIVLRAHVESRGDDGTP